MKRVVLIVVAIVILLALAAGGFIAFKAGWISIKSASKEYTYAVGDFTVNLDDPGYKRYMKVKIQAAYDYKKLDKELTEKSDKIKNTVNNVLRSKKLDDVNTPEKTDAVKNEIKVKVNEMLANNKIKDIYFTEIIIQ